MKIAGLEKNSFVDYPGKIAAVVFTPGCNLDCYYCHNRVLLLNKGTELLPVEGILEFLKRRRKFLDGVVITGGEPTLQKGLEGFIREVKDLGYSIKLDTNGTNPLLLKDFLEKQLVDYVAMDVKAPLERYQEICGTSAYSEEIEDSIRLLKAAKNTVYEFRTTFIPELSLEDIEEIACMIEGADLFVLQQYRIPEVMPDTKDLRYLAAPHSPSYIKEAADRAAGRVKKCITRGI